MTIKEDKIVLLQERLEELTAEMGKSVFTLTTLQGGYTSLVSLEEVYGELDIDDKIETISSLMKFIAESINTNVSDYLKGLELLQKYRIKD